MWTSGEVGHFDRRSELTGNDKGYLFERILTVYEPPLFPYERNLF